MKMTWIKAFRSSSFGRWTSVALFVVASVVVAVLFFGWDEYVQNWGATLFKALSGGVIGWAISRYVVHLNLSQIPPEQRPMAALSQAILIGSFAVALATGA